MDPSIFIDPIDDSTDLRRAFDRLYKDGSGNTYLKTNRFESLSKDTLLFIEFFKDVTGFIDLNTYRTLSQGYFQNKGKVYLWWVNSDGDYPIEVKGADPVTFQPFDSIAGGIDNQHVFYGGPPSDFEIIPGANPKTIKVLNPKRGCWNCGNCYFVDDQAIYYGFNRVNGADPATFYLVNKDSVDAEDMEGIFFNGRLIGRKTQRSDG